MIPPPPNPPGAHRWWLAVAWLWLWLMPLARAEFLAWFRTDLGTLEVVLYDRDKPVTVQNFIRYIQSGKYQNMVAHRWEPGFVLQGGRSVIRLGTNGPPLAEVEPFEAIVNEYGVGRTFSNVYGTIAMARVPGFTNSANSQWYFNLADNVGLDGVDGGFTVFGRVVRGTNVLARFNNTHPTNNLYFYYYQPNAEYIPVISYDGINAYFLVVDVSLLKVQLGRTNGQTQIAWTSVAGKTNRVEYATTLPPAWRSLVQTIGTGGIMQVLDAAGGAPARFYRVRVDY